MRQTGATKFYLPSADYIWPHVMNKKVREVVSAEGGSIVGEEYFPMDHMDFEQVVEDIMASRGRRGVQHDRSPRAHAVPRTSPRGRLHRRRRPRGVHLLRRELPEPGARLTRRGALRLSRLLPGRHDPFSEPARPYEERYPGSAMFTAGSACTGTYRGLKLWEAAVNEAGSLDQDDVVAGARPRADRRGARRRRRDGARSAPPSAEHVHRPVPRRHVQGGQEPRHHRPEGV